MKFTDFQAPALFSCTFKALNLGEKNEVLSRMHGNPVFIQFLRHNNSTETKVTTVCCLYARTYL